MDRGKRIYNGLPSKLMNQIYDGLVARDETIPQQKGWAIFSLYLARACGVIEKQNELKDKALEYTEKLCLVYENSDKQNLKNVQKIMDNIYRNVHCVQKTHSCYSVHNDWREKLANQNWKI